MDGVAVAGRVVSVAVSGIPVGGWLLIFPPQAPAAARHRDGLVAGLRARWSFAGV